VLPMVRLLMPVRKLPWTRCSVTVIPMTTPVRTGPLGDIAVPEDRQPAGERAFLGRVEGLADAVAAFEANVAYRALLIYCRGRTFVAVGDITAFGAPDFFRGACTTAAGPPRGTDPAGDCGTARPTAPAAASTGRWPVITSS